MLQTHILNRELFIADDDEWVRDLLSSQFTLSGYQVTTFEEGTSLIRAARARIPACILLDICMPGPSGLDILKNSMPQIILRQFSSYPAAAIFRAPSWRSRTARLIS